MAPQSPVADDALSSSLKLEWVFNLDFQGKQGGFDLERIIFVTFQSCWPLLHVYMPYGMWRAFLSDRKYI